MCYAILGAIATVLVLSAAPNQAGDNLMEQH
jgi:hypothetical protein